MKNIHVTFALIFATVTWADPNMPYAFFASFNTTLAPLHLNDPKMRGRYFTWGDLSTKASEFFYENGIARSSNPLDPGYVNIDNCSTLNMLLGQETPGSQLQFSENMKLTNMLFYSCPESKSSNIIYNKGKSNCFLVDIYFLPYNKTTNAPMDGSYTAKEKLDLIPHVFFVERKKTVLEPLYSESIQPNRMAIVPFNHGKRNKKPIELYFQDDHAITVPNVQFSGPAGSSAGEFGYGFCTRDIDLGLNENMKLVTRRLFSCHDVKYFDHVIVSNPFITSDRLVLSNVKSIDCVEVDMYLLPYNRTSGRPMEGSYVPHIDDKIPSNFYIRADETFEPLSYYTTTDAKSGKDYGIFLHKKPTNKAIEFTMKYKIAYTEESSTPGFAGFFENKLAFGGFTMQTPFKLDGNMRITGHHFYSCAKDKDPTSREIFVDTAPSDTCYKVNIYIFSLKATRHLVSCL